MDGSRALNLVKARAKQRTDATHVLATIRTLNRLELVGETIRSALNELARIAPGWLSTVAPREWYERYSRRIEDDRVPRSQEKRAAYAQTVGIKKVVEQFMRRFYWLSRVSLLTECKSA